MLKFFIVTRNQRLLARKKKKKKFISQLQRAHLSLNLQFCGWSYAEKPLARSLDDEACQSLYAQGAAAT